VATLSESDVELRPVRAQSALGRGISYLAPTCCFASSHSRRLVTWSWKRLQSDVRRPTHYGALKGSARSTLQIASYVPHGYLPPSSTKTPPLMTNDYSNSPLP
jgi:hypothetical protein